MARRLTCARVAMLAAAAVVLLLAFAAGSADAHDLFARLGIERSASEKDVKKAYKKLVRKLHPDMVPAAEKEAASAKFREVTEAYEILSDPAKREQYESSGGRRMMGGNEDRQFLRHNLFNEFDGVQLKDEGINKLMGTSIRPDGATMVFFWSSNFPDCIDSAPAFKQLATRMRGTSVTVASYKCDDDPMPCRQLNVGQLPSIRMFPTQGAPAPYTGKIEIVALTTFTAKFLKIGNIVWHSSAAHIVNSTPSAYPALRGYGIGGNFLWATAKRSHVGTLDFGLVTLEYGPCFDCETALQLALETVVSVMPALRVHRVNCKKRSNAELCNAHREKDRAWTFLLAKRTCWYATKKPFRFSDEHCLPLETKPFNGKYANDQLVNFIVSAQRRTDAKRFTPSRWVDIKKDNDSWAVLFDDGEDLSKTVQVQWSLLAKSFKTRPYANKKGFNLHVAAADCRKYPAMCEAYAGRQRPFVAIFGFGTKVKTTEPIFYDKVGGWKALRKDLERDTDPLHLYVLGQKNYDKKINDGLKKGKAWFVLYNAGEWCPPCNQIRKEWKEAVRLVMNSEKAKKIHMAIVECDKNKKFCNGLGIQNYPTMSLITKGRPKLEYNGMRDGHEIAKFAIDTVDNRLLNLHPSDLNGRVQRGENVLVCFSAGQWCPPCTAIKPTMKKLANTMTKIAVASINCDDMGQFCNSYGIDGYPTVVLFTKGRRLVYESVRKEPTAIANWANQFLQ